MRLPVSNVRAGSIKSELMSISNGAEGHGVAAMPGVARHCWLPCWKRLLIGAETRRTSPRVTENCHKVRLGQGERASAWLAVSRMALPHGDARLAHCIRLDHFTCDDRARTAGILRRPLGSVVNWQASGPKEEPTTDGAATGDHTVELPSYSHPQS